MWTSGAVGNQDRISLCFYKFLTTIECHPFLFISALVGKYGIRIRTRLIVASDFHPISSQRHPCLIARFVRFHLGFHLPLLTTIKFALNLMKPRDNSFECIRASESISAPRNIEVCSKRQVLFQASRSPPTFTTSSRLITFTIVDLIFATSLNYILRVQCFAHAHPSAISFVEKPWTNYSQD